MDELGLDGPVWALLAAATCDGTGRGAIGAACGAIELDGPLEPLEPFGPMGFNSL